MINFLFFILICSQVFCQGLVTNSSYVNIIKNEVNSLMYNKISDELFIAPYIQKNPDKNKHLNLTAKLIKNQRLIIEPIASIRFSNSGFEFSEKNTKSFWFTPGIKIKSIIPIVNNFKSIWMYSWTEFYKHSSIFEHGLNNPHQLFKYNPNYSIGFYTSSIEPSKGYDFDESQAGISILSNSFELVFGKFKTSFGPFFRGNLSISNHSPALDQVLIKLKDEKFIFSYMIASLDSNLPRFHSESLGLEESELFTDQWLLDDNIFDSITSNYTGNARFSSWERYVAYHRLDFKIKPNLRLGVYEKIIFGGRSIPLSYLIPILPFWSSQHESGDLDNLMIGFDFDFISSKCMNDKPCRFYGAIMMDEWAPYSTFSKDNRNWFAFQIGFSKLEKFFSKSVLFKLEYTKIPSNVYNHRFIINEPKHHGYNLGFWSGNHSDDFFLSSSIILNNDSYINFSYENTRFTNNSYIDRINDLENQYNNISIGFLENGYNKRIKTNITYSFQIQTGIFFDLGLSSFDTKGLYSKNDFYDFTIKIRYNIFK